MTHVRSGDNSASTLLRNDCAEKMLTFYSIYDSCKTCHKLRVLNCQVIFSRVLSPNFIQDDTKRREHMSNSMNILSRLKSIFLQYEPDGICSTLIRYTISTSASKHTSYFFLRNLSISTFPSFYTEKEVFDISKCIFDRSI